MSTLAEIEAAAATLSLEEMKQLEDFLRERRAQAEEGVYRNSTAAPAVHPLPQRRSVITKEMVKRNCEEEEHLMRALLDVNVLIALLDRKAVTMSGQRFS